jgi:Tfp pilus assembly protein PilV
MFVAVQAGPRTRCHVAAMRRSGTVRSVKHKTQEAFTLLETLIAVAAVGVAVGGLIGAVGAFARFSTHPISPMRSAATLLVKNTLLAAQDAWKYGSPGTALLDTWDTTVPLAIPGNSPVTAPVTLSVSASTIDSARAQLTVSARYTPGLDRHGDTGAVSMSGQAYVKAPLPGATVFNPALIAKPSAAP